MANETVRGVCAKMRKELNQYWWDVDRGKIRDIPDRILAAHKREMAAKDAEIARLRKDRDYYREMYEALIKGGVVR